MDNRNPRQWGYSRLGSGSGDSLVGSAVSPWPALIDAFPYLPTETHKSKRGYVREKIASYSGIIPWPKGWRHHDKCEIKIYGFWSDPETGLTHITLMSNVGYDCYRRMNPHNSMKTP